jgi:raffinose/stachyose/melibiose transport system substrate-binding protein
MKKMSVIVALLSVIFVLIISGCNTNAPGSKNASSAKIMLKVGGKEYDYTKPLVEDFKKQNPDIEIKLENGVQTVDDGSLQALLKSGSGPDVLLVYAGPSRIGALSKDGLIRPINDIYEKYKIGDRYQKSIIDQVKAQDKKGDIYEVVEGTDVNQVYYNKQIFKDLNITVPPTSWEEFLAICQKLKEAKIKPIAAGFKGGVSAGHLGGLLLESGAGKDRMSEVIYKGASFNTDPFKLGFEMLKELKDKGYINGQEALAMDMFEAASGFYHGQYAMFATNQALLLSAKKGDGGIDTSKYGSFVLTSREQGRSGLPTAGVASSWVVSASASNEKLPAIEKWINYVSSQDYLKVSFKNGSGFIPALKDIPSDLNLDPLVVDPINKSKNGVGFNPSVYLTGSGKTAWYAALQAVVGGAMTPEEAVKSVDKAIQN